LLEVTLLTSDVNTNIWQANLTNNASDVYSKQK